MPPAIPWIRAIVLSVMVVLCAACSKGGRPGGYDLSAAWTHTDSKEGNVTIVRTTAGSVWRGRARLAEDLSLGSEAGPEANLFGEVAGIAEWEGRIFVLDSKVPVLRMYDRQGRYLRDIGRKGEGPGEFISPASLIVSPADGRMFVQDSSRGRIIVFSPAGDFLESWRIKPWPGGREMVVTSDGMLYLDEVTTDPATGVMNVGSTMAGVGPGGPTGKTLKIPRPDFKAAELVYMRRGNATARWFVPFSPRAYWRLSPSGAMVHGVSVDYRFDVALPSGETTRIFKKWDTAPVEPAEKAWYKAALTASARRVTAGWSWDGPAIPDVKPAYKGLFTDLGGRIWVARQGRGRRVQNCQETPANIRQFLESPCWVDALLIDVFEESGRYLGEVEVPEGFQLSPPPFIRDDVVLAVVRDAEGNDRVKRFRLKLP